MRNCRTLAGGGGGADRVKMQCRPLAFLFYGSNNGYRLKGVTPPRHTLGRQRRVTMIQWCVTSMVQNVLEQLFHEQNVHLNSGLLLSRSPTRYTQEDARYAIRRRGKKKSACMMQLLCNRNAIKSDQPWSKSNFFRLQVISLTPSAA